MRIAVYRPEPLPLSIRLYLDYVSAELTGAGVTLLAFTDRTVPATGDLVWEPCTGRNAPTALVGKGRRPHVVTFHGAANLALPIVPCFGPGLRNLARGWRSRVETWRGWRARGRFWDAVIAVSAYASEEARQQLRVPAELITVIPHGVDHGRFFPLAAPAERRPYLLHVSAGQPKKNLERVIAAHQRLAPGGRPPLVVVTPGYRPPAGLEGVEVVARYLGHEELAGLYQGALGLVFPSLHETFGLPILEAMACGCPVITSDHPGCVEIAGGAALLVDPRSVEGISQAMARLVADERLGQQLRESGLRNAGRYTWARCAEEHARLFAALLRGAGTGARAAREAR